MMQSRRQKPGLGEGLRGPLPEAKTGAVLDSRGDGDDARAFGMFAVREEA